MNWRFDPSFLTQKQVSITSCLPGTTLGSWAAIKVGIAEKNQLWRATHPNAPDRATGWSVCTGQGLLRNLFWSISTVSSLSDSYLGHFIFRVLITSVMSYSLQPLICSQPGSFVHRILTRQEYWSGKPFPSLGDLDPGIEPRSPALQADSLPFEPQRQSHIKDI